MKIKCDFINCENEMKTFYFDIDNDDLVVCKEHKKAYMYEITEEVKCGDCDETDKKFIKDSNGEIFCKKC